MSQLSKKCPIPRPVWGFTMQQEVDMGKLVPGTGRQLNITAQSVNQDHHELAVVDFVEYTFICKFCGMMQTQAEWWALLNQDDVSPLPFPRQN